MMTKRIFLTLIFSVILLSSCSKENTETYNEQVDKINLEFVSEKKDLVKKHILKNLEDSLNVNTSVKEINQLEIKYEKKLNEINDLFLEHQVIRPFQIKKTTDLELANYGVQVGINVKNRTVFNYLLNEAVNLIIKMSLIAGIVLLFGFIFNHTSPFALFKALFSHIIVFILFAVFSYFLSPAKYFGWISSDLEKETEKIITLNIEKTEKDIKEIKRINLNENKK